MPRKASFDRDKARDRCLEAFWMGGYQATSVEDLLRVSGLSASSFYRTFTDKRSLFAECLDVFAERTRSVIQDKQRDLRPIAALKAFFMTTQIEAGPRRDGYGCMLVNTAAELAGVDEKLSRAASDHLESVERLFAKSLRSAGHSKARADQMARLLMLVNEGARVSGRRGIPARVRMGAIEAALSMIEETLPQKGGRADKQSQ